MQYLRRHVIIFVGTCWAILDIAWSTLTGRKIRDDDD